LAKAYEKKEKYAEAIDAWKKVLEIDPQHHAAKTRLTRLGALMIHE
jgi:tetratricopeptide (TPR) repeat protein